MSLVWATEPFICSSPDGPVNVSDKTPYADDHEIVQRFPERFITPELMAERGDGRTMDSVQVDNAGKRGRLK